MDDGWVAQRQRVRITDSMRAEIIRRYEAGATSRQVAAASGTSKATVLKILKESGTNPRPVGARY